MVRPTTATQTLWTIFLRAIRSDIPATPTLLIPEHKTGILFVLLLLLVSHNESSFAREAGADANPRWYELSFEQLLESEVVTATRAQTPITESPSSVTVYTADDIKRMGIRNIKELLERTTGFFLNKQIGGPAIGARGIIGDNEQFLLLIDGHNANSIVDKGPGNFFLFPFIEQVARVEIQRGPGSTLWGSDAALGIIHIITMDGTDLNGVHLSASAATEDNYRYYNLRGGEQISSEADYMFSLSAGESGGFMNPDDTTGHPFGYLPPDSKWERFDDSFELYFKARLRDTTLYARAADMKNLRPIGSISAIPETFYDAEDTFTRRRHYYLDLQHQKTISDSLSLEARLFTDLMERWQSLITPILSGDTATVEESAASRENAMGLELIARWQAHPQHRILAGLRGVSTEVDPVSNAVNYPIIANPPTEASVNMRVVPDNEDRNIAVFLEDDWQLHANHSLLVGIRIDDNNLRENNTIVLPRVAYHWKISSLLSMQYSYTTGYIRPPVGIGFLGQAQYNRSLSEDGRIFGAKDSQDVDSHELRLMYHTDRGKLNWTVYQTHTDNSFNFIYESAVVDGETHILYYANTPEITTLGTELEFSYRFTPRWEIYGNAAYIFESEIDQFESSAYGVNFNLRHSTFGFAESVFTADGTLAAYPHQIYNLGINMFCNDNLSVNLHWRRWNEMYSRKANFGLIFDESREYGPEDFVDLNLRYQKIAGTPLDISFFVKNLLNNDESEVGLLYGIASWSERARSIGLKVGYSF